MKKFDYTILFDLINLSKIRRALLYGFCLLIVLTVQNNVLSRIAPLGVKAMVVPCFVVGVGMFEGGLWGGVFGIITGILCDMGSSGTTVMYLLVFAVEGFASGMLAELFVNRRLYSYMILSVGALLFLALCQTVPLWIYAGTSLGALARVGLLQALWTLPLAVPCYFACRAVGRRRVTE